MPTGPCHRRFVYNAIDSERDYQERLKRQNGQPVELRPHSVEEYVLYMEDYLRELKTQLSRNWTPDRSCPTAALHTLRKVTALGVAAMEDNGALER